MSLLMDALRRAEQAKEQARTEQPGGAVVADAAASAAAPRGVPARLVTSVTDPATSRNEAAVPARETGGELPLSIDEVTPVSPPPAAGRADRPALPRDTVIAPPTSDYSAAQRLITARARQSRRRRLFYVAGGGGALLIVVLAVIYFEVAVSTARLHASQPVSPPPGQELLPPADEGQTPLPASAQAANTPQGDGPGAVTSHADTGPVVSGTSPVSTRRRLPAATEPGPDRDISAAAAPSPSPVVIAHSQTDDPVPTLLAQAFDAYQAGHDEQAEAAYRRVLTLDANNRDALLGLAAVTQHGGRAEEARVYYQRLLEINPLDSAPVAGLVGLRDTVDPIQDESRIKLLLRQDPSAHLFFALGTLYVAQSRWAEAQQSFFDAYSRDPANADAAFNLAVCLDRLAQPASALEYYRRSLDLARGQVVNFKEDQVGQRIAALTAAMAARQPARQSEGSAK